MKTFRRVVCACAIGWTVGCLFHPNITKVDICGWIILVLIYLITYNLKD